jgi:hypothetical protein
MISFDAAHAAVHYPPDRRFRIWVRPSILIAAALLAFLPVLAAWLEVLLVGLPHIPPVAQVYPNNFAGPHGFPLWVRHCHFFNFLFVTMLIRSGRIRFGEVTCPRDCKPSGPPTKSIEPL